MMYVGDPIYRYAIRSGKYAWRFTAASTWTCGFFTFEMLYLIYRTAPFTVLPANLAGPNDFISVIVGDCLALPAINALIVIFYSQYERYVTSVVPQKPPARLTIAGSRQSLCALIVAVLAGAGTYTWWFVDKKVDWTIPRPGQLNGAGIYHALFLTAEIYLLVNFTFSAWRVFVLMAKRELPGLDVSNKGDSPIALPRIVGGMGICAGVFALALLTDVHAGRIPVASYYATALFDVISIVMIFGLAALAYYRGYRKNLIGDVISLSLYVVAILLASLPLAYVVLHRTNP